MWEMIIILGLMVPFCVGGTAILMAVIGYLEEKTIMCGFRLGFIGICIVVVWVLITMMIIDYYSILLGIEDIFEFRE